MKKFRLFAAVLCLAAVTAGACLLGGGRADAATGGDPKIGSWTSSDETVLAVDGVQAGGIATVTYSQNTWYEDTDPETQTPVVKNHRVTIDVEEASPETVDSVSFKYVNGGAEGIRMYVAYYDDTETVVELYAAASLISPEWNVEIFDYGTWAVAQVELNTGGNAVLVGKKLKSLILEFDSALDTEKPEIDGERKVEFQGIAFHAASEAPFAPTEPVILAPVFSAGSARTHGTVRKNADGSYDLSYNLPSPDYSRVAVGAQNFTAEDKCVTVEFTPYAGQIVAVYYAVEGSSDTKMVTTHTTYPVAEKQTVKFEADGAVSQIVLYIDRQQTFDDMRTFTLNKVTIEKNWPVVLTEFEPKNRRITATDKQAETDYAAWSVQNDGAYPTVEASVNATLWNKMTPVKFLTIDFTPLAAMKLGVYADSVALKGVDETGAPVAFGHVAFAAGVRKTVTYEIRDELIADEDGNPVAPSAIKLYLDAGETSDTPKTLAVHAIVLKGQPTVGEVSGDAVHYVKYDEATRETIVTFSSHGVAWYKLTMGLVDYNSDYDIIAFRVKADRDMALGIRMEFSDGTHIDLRYHEIVDGGEEYDLIYLTDARIDAETIIEMYLDAPGKSPLPVEDTSQTTFTILGMEFLRSSDLVRPVLTVEEQVITKEYTGENIAADPEFTVEPALAETYLEYLDTEKAGAQWSAVAPIDVGTYKVRVATVLTREYMAVDDGGEHITLQIEKSKTARELPQDAVRFDYATATVTFGADIELSTDEAFGTQVTTGSAFAPSTTYYARYKETPNMVAGKTAQFQTGAKPTAPALTLKSKGKDYLEFEAVDGAEYSIDGGTTWQDGARFGDLDAGETYTISARIKGSATSFASDVTTATFTTATAGGGKKGCKGSAAAAVSGFALAAFAACGCLLARKKRAA